MPLAGTDYEHLGLDGYVNINTIHRQPDRLHGTESFMGDWNGKLLVLAQDFCHAEFLRIRLRANPSVNPFYHDPARTVNGNLLRQLQRFLPKLDSDGSHATTCGALYANIIWLLKETPAIDSGLPETERAVEESRPTVLDTIAAMPELKAILCVGQVPYEGLLRNLRIRGRSWRRDLDGAGTVVADGVKIVPTAHRVANRVIGTYPPGYRRELVARDIEKCFA
jgi:uracil-DNA glycosylase